MDKSLFFVFFLFDAKANFFSLFKLLLAQKFNYICMNEHEQQQQQKVIGNKKGSWLKFICTFRMRIIWNHQVQKLFS